MTQFCLSWDSHPKNISTGLSSLQQNGEFVDMTIAADGHLVKVHQVIIALASPYLKELINTAACPHPVIYLHNISYTTLQNILEYIYTGEALISIENINNLIEAGKSLHIKGLDSMTVEEVHEEIPKVYHNTDTSCNEEVVDDSHNFDIENSLKKLTPKNTNNLKRKSKTSTLNESEIQDVTYLDEETIEKCQTALQQPLQFSISNQGSLQLILNRYLYYLKHTNKHSIRQWRCVDYISAKCPAYIMTTGDIVTLRAKPHNHAYHDDKIMKKVRRGAIFSAMQEAVDEAGDKKRKKTTDEEEETLELND